jgi:lipid-A-disaccharide synthase
MAGAVVELLGMRSFGLTGPALRGAGSESVADLTQSAAIGLVDALKHAPRIAGATHKLLGRSRRQPPCAALLVGFSEVNAHIGTQLRQQGVRVLWYAPPQVWAWRARRVQSLQRAADHIACVLPFERAIWARAGIATTYVGHPALHDETVPRRAARDRLRLTPYAEVAALLPGSRSAEVRRTLPAMLHAVAELRADRGAFDARILLAPTLPPKVLRWAEAAGQRMGVGATRLSGKPLLSAFDIALVASGTATLECALSGVPPVIVYRTGGLTEAVARRLILVKHIGLPNLVLGRRAFPELVQAELTASALALQANQVLDERDAYLETIAELRHTLEPHSDAVALGATPAARVASLIRSWQSP